MPQNGTPQVNVPAATPTVGAVLGGLLASWISTKTSDPMAVVAIQTLIPGLITYLAHLAHQKLGTPE